MAGEARHEPDLLHEAPVTTPVRRLDEAKAARELKLRWSGSPGDGGGAATESIRTAADHPTI